MDTDYTVWKNGTIKMGQFVGQDAANNAARSYADNDPDANNKYTVKPTEDGED